ncbi:MAG: hypothetical protein EAZ09_13785 [Oscillatoriales cyanobacterium]|nr:MAG: hypothetical protein EAZ18_11875 [Oscillatoriales cyanobacterium]TAH20657.1 MAG: hypothetical protein EAZ09_13785 [Oscillatoriales cyanobacterium]
MLDRLTITYVSAIALRLSELTNLVTHFCLPSSDRRYITWTVREQCLDEPLAMQFFQKRIQQISAIAPPPT